MDRLVKEVSGLSAGADGPFIGAREESGVPGRGKSMSRNNGSIQPRKRDLSTIESAQGEISRGQGLRTLLEAASLGGSSLRLRPVRGFTWEADQLNGLRVRRGGPVTGISGESVGEGGIVPGL